MDKNKYAGFLFLLCVAMSSCNSTEHFEEPLPETVDFNFHVKPILVQNCYLCHGPDPSSRKADLRLDTYKGATALLEEGGQAIVPGRPSKSVLIHRINHKEEDQVMPPPESNYKLSSREKALLEKWIDQGAEWKDHWSFIKPETNIGLTDMRAIDRLIDHQIEQKGLKKSPQATKNALIRRVSYLITGLPPTPEAVENFLTDNSPDAYSNMVNTYLDAPAFGERWARHWMDLVRYAETKGHEFDYAITGAWKYRDYLIRAFNEDVPYDQFLKEHLAGDLLSEVRYSGDTGISESPLATAFYAMGEGTHSPVDIKQDEADRIDNMIDVTSKTFQGLTVACARCHDHKFDPILTADYYSMYGIMESTRFSPVSADRTADQQMAAKEIEEVKNYIEKLIAKTWHDVQAGSEPSLAKKGSDRSTSPGSYQLLGDFRNKDLNGWRSDGLAFGNVTTLGEPLIDGAGNLIGLDRGRASSRRVANEVFGALRSPNIVLEKDFIGIRARGNRSTLRIIIDNFQLIQNPIYGGLQQGVNESGWYNYVFDVSAWKGHKAYIEVLPGGFKTHSYELPEDAYIEVEYAISYENTWPEEVEYTWATTATHPKEKLSRTWVNEINEQLKKGRLREDFKELKSLVDSSTQLAAQLKDTSFFYGIKEGFGINSPVFIRGNYQDPSEDLVSRGFLSTLSKDSSFQTKGSGRLELAEAMLNKDNPLTSRVMVNRIWHLLFGKGIVETVDNFGAQGKLPSHPELLDFLAVKFQQDGWSVKNMIRYIVNSEAFQRSTVRDEELTSKDPTNQYLASFPLRRLEAEAIRDAILSVTGNLNSKLYGPPVPTYLTEFMQGRGRPASSGPLDGDGRRSIYLEVRRNFLEPMMITFDRPIPFSTFGKRNVTNVPAQSLIIMNDPFVASQAELMAKKVLSQPALNLDQRIDWIYQRAFSRKPTTEEIEKARTFISMLEQEHQEGEEQLTRELLVWKSYCHSIFNLKEFIFLI
ncbi:MAG: PSD1 and planctomycete cytochrome C domain-containing protein [Flavobacteriaceae bacterium]